MANFVPTLNDLSNSNNGYEPSLSDVNSRLNQNNTASTLKNIASYFPKPEVPIGMNVFSGLASSLLPKNAQDIAEKAPQIAAGSHFGIPQMIASGIGKTVPSLITAPEGIIKNSLMSGLQGAAEAQPGERLQGGLINSLASLGLGHLIPTLGRMGSSLYGKFDPSFAVSPKTVGTEIQKIHDNLSNEASQGFEDVTKAVNQRNIDTIPLWNREDDLSEDMGNLISNGYLSNTKANKNLIDKALNGDFQSLRKLQSDLWTKGTKAQGSSLASERNMSDEMFEVRDKMNQAISDHLENTGNKDLAKLLNDSRFKYLTLRQNFYDKNLPKSIPNLVGEKREVPNNLLKILQKDSAPMNKLRNYLGTGSDNPEQNMVLDIPSLLKTYHTKENVINLLKSIGSGTGLAGTLAAYKYLLPQHTNIQTNQSQNP